MNTDKNNDALNHKSNTKYTLITFDIDGTLLIGLNKGTVHRDSYKSAVYNVLGVKEELPKYRPGTDLGVSKQIIEHILKIKNNDPKGLNKNEINDEMIQKFIKCTEDHYIDIWDGKLTVMPGIANALEYLSHLSNVRIALCTGNFKRIALLKIEKAHLTKYFSPYVIGGFGNNYESRTDILRESHRNAEKVFGIKFDRFIHIGDSPADVEAANTIGTVSILVRTTPYDFHESEYQQPDFTFANLKVNYDDFVSVVQTGRATDSYYKSHE